MARFERLPDGAAMSDEQDAVQHAERGEKHPNCGGSIWRKAEAGEQPDSVGDTQQAKNFRERETSVGKSAKHRECKRKAPATERKQNDMPANYREKFSTHTANMEIISA